MAGKRFKVRLSKVAKGQATFLVVPFDVRKVFGRARLPVRGTLEGAPFRSTVAIYGGKYFLPVNAALRAAAGVEAGQTVTVELAPDDKPRTVRAPPDLARALAKDSAAKAAWDRLSFTHRKEHAGALAKAKKPETRARRLAATLSMLRS